MMLDIALVGLALVAAAILIAWSVRQPLGFSRRKPVGDLSPSDVLALAQDNGISPAQRRKRALLAGHDRARVRWSGPLVTVFEGEQSCFWLSFHPERRTAMAGASPVSAAFPMAERDRLLALRPGARVTIEATLVVTREGDVELHDPLLADAAA
jgi:hypothetical protein